jgi:N-acetylneuraminate lyase
VIDQQARLLVESGVKGAFVCGTTGEGASLTTDERMQVARRWREAAGDALPVIVHAGHNSLAEARALAAHAQQVGAFAVAAVAPSFFKPAAVDDLVTACAAVADAAPALPFFYYDIPTMTGVHLSAAEFLPRAVERIPTFAGLKFTKNDLIEFQLCQRANAAGCDLFFGYDELLLPALAVGARAAVGSSYNYAAPVYQRILRAAEAGRWDEARAAQAEVLDLFAVVFRYGVLPAGKAVMGLMGIECGPPRPPVRGLSADERRALGDQLKHLKVFARPLRG